MLVYRGEQKAAREWVSGWMCGSGVSGGGWGQVFSGNDQSTVYSARSNWIGRRCMFAQEQMISDDNDFV